MTNKCIHMTVSCLNQYELIRKYICEKCNEVMMCSCDEEHGQRFLPHQIHFGFWLHSQERVPVTLGFQPKICPECRGEKPVAVPKASMYGATSKIMRYYWREISFETTRRYYDAHPEQNQNDGLVSAKFFSEERRKIKEEVIKDIKLLHKINPKYEYSEVSQQQIISETETEVILINAEYVRTESRKARIQTGSKISSVEEVAANYFKAQGYQVMVVESVPFHVLFGVFMFLIIQDPGDDKGQFVQFGSRFDFDTKVSSEGLITTKLPKDFGTNGYYKRQEKLIKQHILDLDDIEWLFEYWLEHSYEFRQYLWAHREEDIIKARKLIVILGLPNLQKVLRYMVMDYWRNFCGWPDLIVYNDSEFFFVEVKSSNDKLSEDQKNWFLGNHKHMNFNAKIFKVGKK